MPPDPGRRPFAAVASAVEAATLALIASDPALDDDEVVDALEARHPELIAELAAALTARPEDSGP